MTFLSEYDGPQRVRREELIASHELFRICFGGPENFNEEEALAYDVTPRRGGIYFMAHQGKLVSQIGITHDKIKIYDATIPVASIGGVCTHPEYRGKGLASHLMEYCARQLTLEGARLMLISGDEGVYTRLGSVLHGRYVYFSINPAQRSAWRPTPADLVLRRMTIADALPTSRLYAAEPVHFKRQHSDFTTALLNPKGNTYVYADQWMIERSGQAVAYLFLGSPWQEELGASIRHVGEYAGSRLALVDALQPLLNSGHLREFTWPVPWQDLELIQLLQDCGYSGSVAPLDGHTLRIVNFPGFMHDLRPNLQARLGEKLLRGLRFEQSGSLLGGTGTDQYRIIRGSDRLELDGAAMTSLVMGSAESEAEPIRLPGKLAEVIPALFPIPSWLPGLNYH